MGRPKTNLTLLDTELSELLSEGANLNLKYLSSKHQVSESKLKEIISKHFYLAPRNIKIALVYLFLFVIVSVLAFVSVRYGTDLFIVFIAFFSGLLMGSPFLILLLLLRRARKAANFRVISAVGLFYLVVISILFIFLILAFELNLIIIIIPIFLIYAYVKELHKLNKYFSTYGYKL